MKPFGAALRSLAARALRRLTGSSPRNLLAALLPPGSGGWAPAPVSAYPERRVIVVAPHADDEALGCGGVLLLHAAAAAHLSIVYLTDGSAGSASPVAPDALRELRRAEARSYAQALGARAQFLDAADGAWVADEPLAARLAALIDAESPDLIYLPHPMDTHPDHWQASRLAALALARLRRAPRVRAYEVWSPLPANCVADISAVAARKFELLGCYASQLADTDYRHAIGGLNAYRSMATPQRSGQAEAFHECSAAAYAELVRRMESL